MEKLCYWFSLRMRQLQGHEKYITSNQYRHYFPIHLIVSIRTRSFLSLIGKQWRQTDRPSVLINTNKSPIERQKGLTASHFIYSKVVLPQPARYCQICRWMVCYTCNRFHNHSQHTRYKVSEIKPFYVAKVVYDKDVLCGKFCLIKVFYVTKVVFDKSVLCGKRGLCEEWVYGKWLVVKVFSLVKEEVFMKVFKLGMPNSIAYFIIN